MTALYAIGLILGAGSSILIWWLWEQRKGLKSQLEASHEKSERLAQEAALNADAFKAQNVALKIARQKLRQDYDADGQKYQTEIDAVKAGKSDTTGTISSVLDAWGDKDPSSTR